MGMFRVRGNAGFGGLLALVLCVAGPGALAAGPFEGGAAFSAANPIDRLVLSGLEAKGLAPAALCSDEVFLRRVYLDVIGTLPEPNQLRAFLGDKRADKRERLVAQLLAREEYADYWAMRWSDALRIKAEFPINLWPNAVQAYHRWVRDAVKSNMPYDEFARALLTSSGSNFRVPPVNFYRAIQGQEPGAIAEAAALTFMGTRLASWPEERRAALEAIFSRVAYKPTSEWKEEIICLDPSASAPLDAVLPDGTKVHVEAWEDPREAFADWLIRGDNPWFARNAANRLWAWVMGRGIVEEPDDIRPDNPPSNPALLGYLEKELVRSGYDMRHLLQVILNSHTYQQSTLGADNSPETDGLFGHYLVQRLDAEVLIDALDYICGSRESYSSEIPEPFTFVPGAQRTIALADGSITSTFLESFGRPSRDTGLASERNNQPSPSQCLYLLNSSDVQRKLERSWRVSNVVKNAKGKADLVIGGLYELILSRRPTEEELAIAQTYFQTGAAPEPAEVVVPFQWAGSKGKPAKAKLNISQAANDLAWALINSKEFLYRH